MTTVARRHTSNAKLAMASKMSRSSAGRGRFTSVVCCEMVTIYNPHTATQNEAAKLGQH